MPNSHFHHGPKTANTPDAYVKDFIEVFTHRLQQIPLPMTSSEKLKLAASVGASVAVNCRKTVHLGEGHIGATDALDNSEMTLFSLKTDISSLRLKPELETAVVDLVTKCDHVVRHNMPQFRQEVESQKLGVGQ